MKNISDAKVSSKVYFIKKYKIFFQFQILSGHLLFGFTSDSLKWTLFNTYHQKEFVNILRVIRKYLPRMNAKGYTPAVPREFTNNKNTNVS